MDERSPRSRACILLVDDTEITRDLVATILTRAGYTVDVAADGEAAWQLTWSKRYDLVLMDIEMPGMSGFEAAARIRAREGAMSGVPIAAFTATHEPNAERLSLWSGIDAFIAKPVLPTLLVARIEAILAKRRDEGDDWAPVWRLHIFKERTRDLEGGEAASCLDELGSLFEEAVAAIHINATSTQRFLRIAANIHDLAKRYGFDEVAGLSALYGDENTGGRSRDPNLLGAIGRAQHAVKTWRREHAALPPRAMAPHADERWQSRP